MDLKTSAKKLYRWFRLKGLGIAIIILGVLSGFQLYEQDSDAKRLASCQNAYSDGFAKALDARSVATEQYQRSLTEVMKNLSLALASTKDPQALAQLQASVNDFLDKTQEAAEARAENPYPDPPRDLCS